MGDLFLNLNILVKPWQENDCKSMPLDSINFQLCKWNVPLHLPRVSRHDLCVIPRFSCKAESFWNLLVCTNLLGSRAAFSPGAPTQDFTQHSHIERQNTHTLCPLECLHVQQNFKSFWVFFWEIQTFYLTVRFSVCMCGVVGELKSSNKIQCGINTQLLARFIASIYKQCHKNIPVHK